MGGVSHRLFAFVWKGEGRGWQRIFLGRRKPAMRGRAVWFPSGFGQRFIFHGGYQALQNTVVLAFWVPAGLGA
jgi:hypothetical protein